MIELRNNPDKLKEELNNLKSDSSVHINTVIELIFKYYGAVNLPFDKRNLIEFFQATHLKLRFTKYHLDKIKTTTESMSRNPSPKEGEPEFLFHCELSAFLFEAKSCLDSLAQLINLVYELDWDEGSSGLKFENLAQRLDNDSEIYNIINHIKEDLWFKRLRKYRNIITHRKLLKNYKIILDGRTGSETEKIALLPDDATKSPDSWTFNEEIKAIEFCETVFNEIHKTVEDCFNNMGNPLINKLNL